MEKRSIGIRRDGGRKISKPQSSFIDKDEEKVLPKSSKVRFYDKIPQSGGISPLDRIETLNNTIKKLLQSVQQDSDTIQQYKLTEVSLKKQNEMMQDELKNSRCLLEKKNQRTEESSVENARLKKQVEELSEKNVELQETYVKILQEKEEQRMEFESVHLDLQLQLSSVSASQMFLEEKTNSLQSEMDRRTLVSEEEKVSLNGRLRELKTSLDSLNKDLESSRAMEQEKQGQIVDLHDQLASLSAAKMLLEEETKSLQSEMNRRTLVSEEENVNLKGIIRELEIARDSLNKDLESPRATEEEKQGQIVDLQDQLSALAAAKMFLEEETNSLQSEMNRRTLVSEEENVNLKGIIRELEIARDSLNKDLEFSRAMEEKRQEQIVDLQDQLSSMASAKMFLEEKTNSLQSEMDQRTSISEKEKISLNGILMELENARDSLYKDLEFSRAMEGKKQDQIVDLQDKLSCLASAKMLLEEETKSLQSEMDRKTVVSEEENVSLKGKIKELEIALESLDQKNNSLVTEMNKCTEENALLEGRIREFEFDLNSLKKDLESKDLGLQELTEKLESHLLENGKLKKDLESKDARLGELTEKLESHLLENGKLKKDLESKDLGLQELTEKLESHLLENRKLKKDLESKEIRLQELTEKVDSQLQENGKANGEQEKPKANGAIDRKTAFKAASEISEKRTPKQVLKERITPKQVNVKPSPNTGRRR